MEINEGDTVIVDVEKAVKYDEDWKLMNDETAKAIVMKKREFSAITVSLLGKHPYPNDYPLHIEEGHVIGNESWRFCNKHDTRGMYHDKYEIRFCPWCGIDRKEKIKRHPLTGKIWNFWQPWEVPEERGVENWKWTDDPEIFLISLPIIGVIFSIADLSMARGMWNDNKFNKRNSQWQRGIIGIVIQSFYTVLLFLVGGSLL